jgi:hypothetical protein
MEGLADLQEFYQTRFVTEALKSDFVLHCLLGLSAFHLVQQHQELLQGAPEQQQPLIRSKISDCLISAHLHHHEGISIFRQTLTMITEENCHSLFAAATLIVMTSCAESCEGVRSVTSQMHSNEDSVPTVTKWLILLRGVKTVLAVTWDWVRTGPMAPILTRRGLEDFDSNIAAIDGDAARYLNRLSAAFSEYSEPEVDRICTTTITLLQETWKGLANGCDFGAAFIVRIIGSLFLHFLISIALAVYSGRLLDLLPVFSQHTMNSSVCS